MSCSTYFGPVVITLLSTRLLKHQGTQAQYTLQIFPVENTAFQSVLISYVFLTHYLDTNVFKAFWIGCPIFDVFYSTDHNNKKNQLFNGLVVGFEAKGMLVRMGNSVH